MEHALPHTLTPNVPESSLLVPADAVSSADPWHARLLQYFCVEFAEFDHLDLGTRREFNAYVCDLFERGPCEKPSQDC